MNKEQVKQRINELQQELDKSSANHNVLVGAVSELNMWLNKIEAEEKVLADQPSASKDPVEPETNPIGTDF